MKIVKAMAGGLMLAAAPLLAHAADDMSYRYVQVGYMETDVDVPGTNETLDGFAVRGSFGFAENFFVFTDFDSQETTVSGVDLELDTLIVGVGGHYALSDTIDLVGRAGHIELDLEASGPGGTIDADEDGYLVGAGLRGQAGENVELEFGVVHADLGNNSDDTGFEVAARYHFDERWAVAVEYQDIGDLSRIFGGVRISF